VFIQFPITRFVIRAAVHQAAEESCKIRCQNGGQIVLGVDEDDARFALWLPDADVVEP
jgi:hypothetical protein